MSASGPTPPTSVLIAGGGVAGLETLLALRELAGERLELTLLAPQPDFVYRPLSVAEPFARGHAERHPLAAIAAEFGAGFVQDAFARLDAAQRTVHTASGAQLGYDVLVLATGCRARPALRRAITFWAERDPDLFNDLLRDIEEGYSRRIAFVVPGGVTWSLPVYELALMTASQARGMGIDGLALRIVTPEDAPLAIFGTRASEMVHGLLEAAGIEVSTGVYAEESERRIVLRPGGDVLDAQRVVALPSLEGLRLEGVPADADGFVPVDDHGRVPGLEGVYAAGDGTSFPIKQGGLATQQADAVAEAIAAGAGADVAPQPFRPVLRGILITGDGERHMRASVAGGGGEGTAGTRSLWWPPAKIAGRHLAPYLRRLSGAGETASEDAPGILLESALDGVGPAREGSFATGA
jgi:sulfide:quinone oxidoreductase